MWEARSEQQWQEEKAFHDISHPFRTFGELMRAKRRPNGAGNVERLDMWEAGTDKMGLLMNFAIAFVFADAPPNGCDDNDNSLDDVSTNM